MGFLLWWTSLDHMVLEELRPKRQSAIKHIVEQIHPSIGQLYFQSVSIEVIPAEFLGEVALVIPRSHDFTGGAL